MQGFREKKKKKNQDRIAHLYIISRIWWWNWYIWEDSCRTWATPATVCVNTFGPWRKTFILSTTNSAVQKIFSSCMIVVFHLFFWTYNLHESWRTKKKKTVLKNELQRLDPGTDCTAPAALFIYLFIQLSYCHSSKILTFTLPSERKRTKVWTQCFPLCVFYLCWDTTQARLLPS